MAPAPGWRLRAGGFHRNWSPLAASALGWERYRPRREAESRGVDLIAVTAGKRPRRTRDDGGLVPRCGQGQGKGRRGGSSHHQLSQPSQGSPGWPPCLSPLGAMVDAGRVWESGAKSHCFPGQGRGFGGEEHLSPGTATTSIL